MKKEQLLTVLLCVALFVAALLPTKKKPKPVENRENFSQEMQTAEPEQDAAQLEQKLSELLALVEGVGRVRVMLTFESTNTKVVEKDIPDNSSNERLREKDGSSREANSSSREETTVYEKDREGRQLPYVISEEYPKLRGVLVIAEGGAKPQVVQEIREAVQALFHIEAHKIKVMKMKS